MLRALGGRARPDDRDGHPRRDGRHDRRPRDVPGGRAHRPRARPVHRRRGARDAGGGDPMTGRPQGPDGAASPRGAHRPGRRAGRGDDRGQPHPHGHDEEPSPTSSAARTPTPTWSCAARPSSRTRRRRPSVPASLLPRIQALPDVNAAAGSLIDLSRSGDNIAKLVDRDGKVITANMPTFGVGIDASRPRFNPLKLPTARGPTGRPDRHRLGHRRRTRLRGGRQIGVLAEGPVRSFRITGLATFGNVELAGRRHHRRLRHPDARRCCSTTPASRRSRSPRGPACPRPPWPARSRRCCRPPPR